MKVSKPWKKITSKNCTEVKSHLPKVPNCDVEQLLRNIDSKKSAAINMIPSKLIKLSAKVLSKPLVIAINNSFQIMQKLHAFTSWINTPMMNILWLKIYEKIVNHFLISKVKYHFSAFTSAYRKSFSTEHAYMRLLEDWRNRLDNANVVSAVLKELFR